MELIRQYGGLKREAYVLFFGRIVTSLGSMIWPVLTLILNQKLGMSASLVALCMLLVSAVSMPAGILGGKLADHYDKKYCIVCCDLVSVVLFIICACIPLSPFSIILLTVIVTVFLLETRLLKDVFEHDRYRH